MESDWESEMSRRGTEQPSVELPTIGKSTLLGKTAKLKGFFFTKHPRRKQWRMQVCVYELLGLQRFPVTLSQVHKTKVNPDAMELGKELLADLIVPFVVREFSGQDWPVVKEVLIDGFKGDWKFHE